MDVSVSSAEKSSYPALLKLAAVLIGCWFLLHQPKQAMGSSIVECGDAIEQLDISQAIPLSQTSINEMIQSLAALRLSLDVAKIEGRSSMDMTALVSDYENKEKILIKHLEKHKIMTRKNLVEEIKQEVARLQKQGNTNIQQSRLEKDEESRRKKEQEKEVKNNAIDGSLAITHRIEPGSFKMGKLGEEVDVTLTKPFDMMATATTQLFYRRVVELADARFPGEYKITADPSRFKGDLRPVERVSDEDVQLWINALNELSKIGEPLLQELIPNHKQGDVYRLPTEAEREFVARGRGTLNGKYHFGDNEADLKDYAWYSENAQESTHPVAQKLPLVIDGKKIFDIHGNVSEWVADAWDLNAPLQGGVDPISHVGSFRVIRGGGWRDGARPLRSAFRYGESPVFRNGYTGFRLVRTVP